VGVQRCTCIVSSLRRKALSAADPSVTRPVNARPQSAWSSAQKVSWGPAAAIGYDCGADRQLTAMHPISATAKGKRCEGIRIVVRVRPTFRFHNRLLYLANAMVDQHIGLEETDDGLWAIHFNTALLATFDEPDYIITG
jgi:hypothetical protein